MREKRVDMKKREVKRDHHFPFATRTDYFDTVTAMSTPTQRLPDVSVPTAPSSKESGSRKHRLTHDFPTPPPPPPPPPLPPSCASGMLSRSHHHPASPAPPSPPFHLPVGAHRANNDIKVIKHGVMAAVAESICSRLLELHYLETPHKKER